MKKLLMLCLMFGFCLIFFGFTNAAEVSLKEIDEGYEIDLDGKLFANYWTDYHGTPIVWPIIGPSGVAMTRAYPMSTDADGEKFDHPHHRSLWFTHDGVNGNRHWMRSIIAHQEFVKAESDGKTATIVTKNDWLDDKSGDPVCKDIRTLVFGTIGDVRYIDFNIEIIAEQETVVFADTKEGSFGIRVPTSMDVDMRKGGTIINAEGKKDGEAWAKRSGWVDYSGPVEGKTVGITVMNHSDSFRYPTYWHVRTYGLFAANPFGVRDFEGDKAKSGELTLKHGESITLKYRVLFHDGDAASLDLPKLFEEYCAVKQQEDKK